MKHILRHHKLNVMIPLVFVIILISSTLLFTACGDTSAGGPLPSGIAYFPEQKSQLGAMDAEMTGKLIVVDGFLRVESPYGNCLPIWPPGYKVRTGKDDVIQVTNRNGHVVAVVGEGVYMSGGEASIPVETVNKSIQQPLPSSAKGPFWIVGYQVRLDVPQDSIFFEWDTLSTGDNTIFFIRKKPLLDDRVSNAWGSAEPWVEKESTVAGELKVFGRSFSVDGFMLFWPSEYRATIQAGAISIVNEKTGETIHVNDRLNIEGYRIIYKSQHHAIHSSLRDQLPSGFYGPYLVVSDVSVQTGSPDGSQNTPDITPGVSPLEGDAALLRMAEAYAADVGVSVDEAMRRLKLQDPIGELGAALEENEKETFAGIWIQHHPDYRLIVQFTSNGEETMRRYIQEGEWAGLAPSILIEVRTADVPLTVLAAEQDEAMRICDQLGIVASSGQDTPTNSVELYVNDGKALEDALGKAGLRLPGHVRVVEVSNMGGPDSGGE